MGDSDIESLHKEGVKILLSVSSTLWKLGVVIKSDWLTSDVRLFQIFVPMVCYPRVKPAIEMVDQHHIKPGEYK